VKPEKVMGVAYSLRPLREKGALAPPTTLPICD